MNHSANPVRLGPRDVFDLGFTGLRHRPVRAVLSAVGIAIGIATMVVVAGIPASSRAALDERLSALGANMLRAQSKYDQQTRSLPPVVEDVTAMVRRIGPIEQVSAVANVQAAVRRSDRVPASQNSMISVLAARNDLLPAVSATIGQGRYLSEATTELPVVVLGARAAGLLGITDLSGNRQPLVWLGERWFTVVGILAPAPLAPDLDRAALVDWSAAKRWLAFDGHPTTVFVRAEETQLEGVRNVLAATVFAENPYRIDVSRPSDALAAKRITETAFSSLFLGLAGVALLVGGVGVANTMVVSILERRREIGLRRALGSTRGQIRGQFLAESVILCLLGGLSGAVVGALGAAAYAVAKGWPVVIPAEALAGGTGGAVLIGVLAGLYPAVRASRMTPTAALATT